MEALITITTHEHLGTFAEARPVVLEDLVLGPVDVMKADPGSPSSKATQTVTVPGLKELLDATYGPSRRYMPGESFFFVRAVDPVRNGARLAERLREMEERVARAPDPAYLLAKANAFVAEVVEGCNRKAREKVEFLASRGAELYAETEFVAERAKVAALGAAVAALQAQLSAAKDELHAAGLAVYADAIEADGLGKFVDLDAIRATKRPSSLFGR